MKLVSLFLTLLIVAFSAAAAGAAPQTLTAVSADTALSTAGGWVAWSEEGDGGWQLVAWHENQKTTLPVAARSVPFDVDLGIDAAGSTVATYSRCKSEPKFRDPNGLPDWSRAKGCRLYELDLASGAETQLRVPGKGSDTTPSRSGNRLAFARTKGGIARLYLWSGGRSLKRLPVGQLKRTCPYKGGCKKERISGSLQQLDLSGAQAAFLWRAEAPTVAGVGPGWQIYVVNTSGKRRLLGNGIISVTCGPTMPTSPNLVDQETWYSAMDYCDPETEEMASKPALLLRGALNQTKVGRAQLEDAIWKTTSDGQGGIYAISSLWPLETGQPCEGGSCQLTYDPSPPSPFETFKPGNIYY